MQMQHVDNATIAYRLYLVYHTIMTKDKQVRVTPRTHKLLKIKSAKLGVPIKEVIKVAIENL